MAEGEPVIVSPGQVLERTPLQRMMLSQRLITLLLIAGLALDRTVTRFGQF
jgi:hypothetical protein